MKYLQILNAGLLALGTAMGVVLAVVCLMYWAHLGSEPRLRDDLPMLLAVTAVFVALAAMQGLAFQAQRKGWGLRWLIQLLPVIPLTGLGLVLASLRG